LQRITELDEIFGTTTVLTVTTVPPAQDQ